MSKNVKNILLAGGLFGGLLLAILTRNLGLAYLGIFAAVLAGEGLLEVNGIKPE